VAATAAFPRRTQWRFEQAVKLAALWLLARRLPG
jgi:hypothetical protein